MLCPCGNPNVCRSCLMSIVDVHHLVISPRHNQIRSDQIRSDQISKDPVLSDSQVPGGAGARRQLAVAGRYVLDDV